MRLAKEKDGLGQTVFTVYDSDHDEMKIIISPAAEVVSVLVPKPRLQKGGDCRWFKAKWFLEIADTIRALRVDGSGMAEPIGHAEPDAPEPVQPTTLLDYYEGVEPEPSQPVDVCSDAIDVGTSFPTTTTLTTLNADGSVASIECVLGGYTPPLAHPAPMAAKAPDQLTAENKALEPMDDVARCKKCKAELNFDGDHWICPDCGDETMDHGEHPDRDMPKEGDDGDGLPF
jgi:hypothetical protein